MNGNFSMETEYMKCKWGYGERCNQEFKFVAQGGVSKLLKMKALAFNGLTPNFKGQELVPPYGFPPYAQSYGGANYYWSKFGKSPHKGRDFIQSGSDIQQLGAPLWGSTPLMGRISDALRGSKLSLCIITSFTFSHFIFHDFMNGFK